MPLTHSRHWWERPLSKKKTVLLIQIYFNLNLFIWIFFLSLKSLLCFPLHSISALRILKYRNALDPQTLWIAKWTRRVLLLIFTRNVFSSVCLLWFSLLCWLQVYSSVSLRVKTEIALFQLARWLKFQSWRLEHQWCNALCLFEY